MKAMIVTGGTGFLGSHFINTISAKYSGHAVYPLVRGNDKNEACTRLNAALALASSHTANDSSTPVAADNIVLGDIQAPDCGVDAPAITKLTSEGIDEFWHFASSLNFEESRRDHIRAHNIGGATHAVNLAIAVKCRKFIYVSTAYTAGDLDGAIPEVIHHEIGFNNYYEETKNEAEKLIQAMCKESGMELVILRPSVVIGPMSTKMTGGSSTGLYGFLRLICKSREVISALGGNFRIYGDGDTGVNLIPVDYLMDDICYLIDQGMPDGGIYHLSVDQMVTNSDFVHAVREVLDVQGFSIEKFDQKTANFIENEARKRTVFYSSYLNSHKEFSRSIPNSWSITRDDLTGFVKEYVKELGAQQAAA
jgi:nucleoside-diphosphate-sugar epimerase